MDFKLTLDLKQQTPMIHFQYNEKGAVIRATELKPKLDSFLASKIRAKGIITDKSWYVKDTKALNYKIRIKAYGNKEVSNTINPMFFGNMGIDENDPAFKKTVFYSGDIKVTVLCFIEELYKLIKDNIQEFFLVHNFGTRQSKGFGGFTVSKINDVPCQNDFDFLCSKLSNYKYFYGIARQSSACGDMLNHALTVSAVLKGGLNLTLWDNNKGSYRFPDRYIKSFIQRDFLDDGTGSEKAYIKSNLPVSDRAVVNEKRRENDNRDSGYDEHVFIRAVFGLADNFEYRNLRYGKINVYNLGDKDFGIKRFKSPITVKIIENHIFFIFDETDLDCILDKEFYLVKDVPVWLSKKSYEEKKSYITANGWSIRTPESVDVNDLIDRFVVYFNENRSRLAAFRNNGRPDPYSNSVSLELKAGGVQNG